MHKTLMEQKAYDQIEWLSELDFRERYQLSKLFLDIPTFCGITGFARSTMYQYIREQRFFIPCTLVNKTPFIKTDDFVGWYLNGCKTNIKKME